MDLQRPMPSDHKTYYGGASIFAIIGIGLFAFKFHNGERYFQNEPLTAKTVIVSDTPRYINGGRSGTDRYTFAVREFACRLWLSEGALYAVKKHDSIEARVRAIRLGDTVLIKVRSNELGSLQDSNSRVRVMGLYQSNSTLVDPAYVYQEDSEGRTINLVAGAIAFAIAAILIVLSILKRYRLSSISS